MAGEATRHGPALDATSPARSTPRAPRARPQCHVHETQADAYPPSPSAPIRLHRLTANNTLAAVGYRCPPVDGDRRSAQPQTVPSRRSPRCGAPAGRRKRDQHHHRPRFLPAARAAARPVVAGDRRPAPPQTAPRAQPVALAFGERESNKTVVNQSRCPMVMPTSQLGWWKISSVVGPCSAVGYVNKGI